MSDEVTGSTDSSSSLSLPFQPGQILGGKYKVLSLIGSGGMGTVYSVSQMFLHKEFALKTLDKRKITASSIRRFQQEAKAASSLSHPNLVQVHDFGFLDDEQPYLVMDLIRGSTLSTIIKEKGQLEIEDTISIIAQVCLGLSYAHDQGVVHRDLKPGNIIIVEDALLGSEGSVKIVDFGIAKIIGNDDGEIQALTNTGEIFGSPLYMSPEQCLGGKVDHRSDIYSLGCVFYECLTGAPPHVGQNALRTMMLHESEPALSLKEAALGKEFPEGLEKILAKMLAKSPAERYPDLGLVAHDLSSIFHNQPLVFASQNDEENAKKRRRTVTLEVRQLAGILALTAILSGGIVGFVTARLSPLASKTQYTKGTRSDYRPGPPAIKKDDNSESLDDQFQQQEKRVMQSIENAQRIEPRIVVDKNGEKKKVIVFPDCKIGMVSYNGLFADAKGKVSTPVDSGLGLLLNDWTAERFLLSTPQFFQKIDPSAFQSLTLSDDKDSLSPSELTGRPAVKARMADVLNIVSSWTKLETLKLEKLTLSGSALGELSKSSSIKCLRLIACEISSDLSNEDSIELKAKTLEFSDLSANNQIISTILRNAAALENLTINDMSLDPEILLQVKHCPHLHSLSLKLKNPHLPKIIKALSGLKQLRTIRINNSLSPADLKALSEIRWLSSIEVKNESRDDIALIKMKLKDKRFSCL